MGYKTHVVKAVLPKLTYRSIQSQSKFQHTFLVEIVKTILKFIWKYKRRPRIAKTSLKKG